MARAVGGSAAVRGVVSDSSLPPARLATEGRGPHHRSEGPGAAVLCWAGKASPPRSPRDAPGGPGGVAVGAAREGMRGKEGEGCWCHTPV